MPTEIGKAYLLVQPKIDENANRQVGDLLGGFSSMLVAKGAALGTFFGTLAADVGKDLQGIVVDAVKWLPQLGAEFDSAMDHIRVAVGDSPLANLALGKSFENVYANIVSGKDEVSATLSLIFQRMNLTGGGAEQLTKSILNLARITGGDGVQAADQITGALSLWNVAGGDAVGVVDELFRASQVSGKSVADLAGDLQAGGLQLRLLGFSLPDTLALSANLGKVGLGIGDIQQGLNKLIAAHPGEDLTTIFDRFVAGIQDGSITLQDALDTLGNRGGAKFYALARDGRLSFEDIEQSIEHGTDNVQKATDATDDWGEKWETFWHRIELAARPVADWLFNTFGGLADALTGKEFSPEQLSGFSSEWDKWSEEQRRQFAGFADAVNAQEGPQVNLGNAWDYVVAKWNEAWPKVQAWWTDTAKPWLDSVLVPGLESVGSQLVFAFVSWVPKAIEGLAKIAPKLFAVASVLSVAFLKGLGEGMRDAIPGGKTTIALLSGVPGVGQIISALDAFADVKIPTFDDGGVVGGYPGKPRLSLVHGGETVLPTHRMDLADALRSVVGTAAGGGWNVTNYITSPSPQRAAIDTVVEMRRTFAA